MKERWDAYDTRYNRIDGMVLERGQKIPEGIYHLVCDVVVRHIDGTYLLMQRSYNKHLGGLWELTAGGSALQNETAYECACRELKEETGIVADKMIEIGRVVHDTRHTLYVEFLCVTDCEKDSIVLQPEETMSYQWVMAEQLKEMCEEEFASVRTFKLLEHQKTTGGHF